MTLPYKGGWVGIDIKRGWGKEGSIRRAKPVLGGWVWEIREPFKMGENSLLLDLPRIYEVKLRVPWATSSVG
jgi:hypothetical protein